VPSQFDHIVIVVNDLEQASENYARAGFNVTPGGEHVSGTTHNALVSFEDGSYFELIALKDKGQPTEAHRWFAKLKGGEGYVAYALLSDDVAADAERLRAHSLEAAEPRQGGRFRPDGQRADWRTTRVEDGNGGPPLPFLIDDQTPRNLRVPDGAAAVHENGVAGIAGAVVVVDDLVERSKLYQTLLGQDESRSQLRESGDSRTLRFQLESGQWIELVEAGSAPDEVRDHFQQYGEGLYSVTLRGSEAHDWLPLDQSHGARIQVSQG
jgi:hypothetical protein